MPETFRKRTDETKTVSQTFKNNGAVAKQPRPQSLSPTNRNRINTDHGRHITFRTILSSRKLSHHIMSVPDLLRRRQHSQELIRCRERYKKPNELMQIERSIDTRQETRQCDLFRMNAFATNNVLNRWIKLQEESWENASLLKKTGFQTRNGKSSHPQIRLRGCHMEFINSWNLIN